MRAPAAVIAAADASAAVVMIAGAGAGSAAVVTIGVACGSLAWWLALTTGVTAVRHAVSERAMTVVNRLSGLALAVFGLLAVASGVSALA